MKVLIADKFNEQLPKDLAKAGHQVTTNVAELADADVLVVRSKTKATAEYLAPAKKLRLVIRGGVGVDNIDVKYCGGKGIIVKNTPEASSVAVAELAVGLMLAFARNLPQAHASTHKGGWEKSAFEGTELMGKTLGLVGAGRIAQEVARRCAAFGMKTIAYEILGTAPEPIKLVGSLDELFKQSDYLSLHVPATPQTEKMINAAALAKMKPTAVIINTARGKCVDEAALAEALKAGKIRGAALDVYAKEPPEGSPLVGCPRLVMTPHLGASTDENLTRIAVRIGELVGELAAGKLKA
jgi:D-3-phosphoglycerate dehydrogenase